MKAAREAGVRAINICGNNQIQNTARSIKRDFLFGEPQTGYYFSNLISYERYWEVLKTHSTVEAKEILKKEFARVQLWQVNADGSVKSLGAPADFKAEFTASVRDCASGTKPKTPSGNCMATTEEHRVACCSEMFDGPLVSWTTQDGPAELH